MPPIKEQLLKYSGEKMENAILEVQRGLPVSTVAKKFGVPRVTLFIK